METIRFVDMYDNTPIQEKTKPVQHLSIGSDGRAVDIEFKKLASHGHFLEGMSLKMRIPGIATVATCEEGRYNQHVGYGDFESVKEIQVEVVPPAMVDEYRRRGGRAVAGDATNIASWVNGIGLFLVREAKLTYGGTLADELFPGPMYAEQYKLPRDARLQVAGLHELQEMPMTESHTPGRILASLHGQDLCYKLPFYFSRKGAEDLRVPLASRVGQTGRIELSFCELIEGIHNRSHGERTVVIGGKRVPVFTCWRARPSPITKTLDDYARITRFDALVRLASIEDATQGLYRYRGNGRRGISDVTSFRACSNHPFYPVASVVCDISSIDELEYQKKLAELGPVAFKTMVSHGELAFNEFAGLDSRQAYQGNRVLANSVTSSQFTVFALNGVNQINVYVRDNKPGNWAICGPRPDPITGVTGPVIQSMRLAQGTSILSHVDTQHVHTTDKDGNSFEFVFANQPMRLWGGDPAGYDTDLGTAAVEIPDMHNMTLDTSRNSKLRLEVDVNTAHYETPEQKHEEYRSYADAKAYLADLDIGASWVDFKKYVDTNPNFPDDIPLRPDAVYMAEWTSWADFLGSTGRRVVVYRLWSAAFGADSGSRVRLLVNTSDLNPTKIVYRLYRSNASTFASKLDLTDITDITHVLGAPDGLSNFSDQVDEKFAQLRWDAAGIEWTSNGEFVDLVDKTETSNCFVYVVVCFDGTKDLDAPKDFEIYNDGGEMVYPDTKKSGVYEAMHVLCKNEEVDRFRFEVASPPDSENVYAVALKWESVGMDMTPKGDLSWEDYARNNAAELLNRIVQLVSDADAHHNGVCILRTKDPTTQRLLRFIYGLELYYHDSMMYTPAIKANDITSLNTDSAINKTYNTREYAPSEKWHSTIQYYKNACELYGKWLEFAHNTNNHQVRVKLQEFVTTHKTLYETLRGGRAPLTSAIESFMPYSNNSNVDVMWGYHETVVEELESFTGAFDAAPYHIAQLVKDWDATQTETVIGAFIQDKMAHIEALLPLGGFYSGVDLQEILDLFNDALPHHDDIPSQFYIVTRSQMNILVNAGPPWYIEPTLPSQINGGPRFRMVDLDGSFEFNVNGTRPCDTVADVWETSKFVWSKHLTTPTADLHHRIMNSARINDSDIDFLLSNNDDRKILALGSENFLVRDEDTPKFSTRGDMPCQLAVYRRDGYRTVRTETAEKHRTQLFANVFSWQPRVVDMSGNSIMR